MDEKSSNHTMLFLTDLQGKILGIAQRGETADRAFSTGIRPLAEQLLHEVEVPDEAFQLRTAHEVYQWAKTHYVHVGEKPRLMPVAE